MHKMNTTRGPSVATVTSPYKSEDEFENDIAFVARMASILIDQIDSGFEVSRGKVAGSSVTLTFQQEGILDLEFAAQEIWLRSKRAAAECAARRDARGAA